MKINWKCNAKKVEEITQRTFGMHRNFTIPVELTSPIKIFTALTYSTSLGWPRLTCYISPKISQILMQMFAHLHFIILE